jgi:cobalt-zinc-cadmium efflux system outer membrane protein
MCAETETSSCRYEGIEMKQIILQVLIGFGLCLFFISPSHGSDGTAGGTALGEIENRFSQNLSLPDLLEFAYLSNPSITASKESWQIFIENYKIGKSYPDPQLMTTYFPSPIETRLGPQDWNLTLSQAIPFPGTLSQKGKVLEADVNIAKLKLDKSIKAMVTQVSTAYYELVYIHKAIAIARANLDLNLSLSKISENAYAQDKALFYDVSRAQAQTAQIQYDILLIQELEQTQKVSINSLLDRDPNAKLGRATGLAPRNPVYSLNEIYELAMIHQEDILIADETIEKSNETIRLSKFETLPSFKLGLFYAGIGQPDVANPPSNAGDDALGVQLGLNLPLWFGKNRSRTSKDLAGKEKAKADKRSTSNRIKAQISRLWFKLQNSKRLMTLYENELIPKALASVQTAETWFQEGEGNFSDFLEIQATAYNFQLSLARARADYSQTLVRLEQLAGVILDRKNEQKSGKKNDNQPQTLEDASHEN